jgi:hypothetical protein
MDNVSEKLGLYDFFNVISVGAIFILHIVFLFPDMLSTYDNWLSDGAIKFAGIFILAYLIGIFFQELGANLENIKFFNMKRKLTTTFLINETIIDNNVKLEQYRKYAKDIWKMKEIEFSEDFTPEQNGYVYSYVEYYIEQKGRNKKFEKMRALYGMSKSLLCCMPFVIVACVIGFILKITSIYNVSIVRILITLIYSSVSIIVYYLRAERCMKYRIRMMMGVYESCITEEKENVAL